ncbi:MAG: hypothetical protein ACI8P0_003491 [Planctomycetaceae bacterium]|jgi:hypothetical protein
MELFVLGAGFSRAFNDKAPLQNSFLSGYETYFDAPDLREAKELIEQLGFDDLAKVNIEDVLTHASLSPPWLTDQQTASLAIAKAQLTQLVHRVIDDSFEKQGASFDGAEKPFRFKTRETAALDQFSEYLITKRGNAQVISFNYDILLDNSLEYKQRSLLPENPQSLPYHDKSSPWFHIGHSYGFQATEVAPHGFIHPTSRGHQSHDVQILKLHGSVNWLPRRAIMSPATPQDLLVLRCHDNILAGSNDVKSVVEAEFEDTPYIVPPILDKTQLLKAPILNTIWNRAARRLDQATKLFFIGYSFPRTDFASEFLFRYHTPADASIVVVNKADSDEEQQAIKSRYDDIFSKCSKVKIDYQFSCAAAFCEALEP